MMMALQMHGAHRLRTAVRRFSLASQSSLRVSSPVTAAVSAAVEPHDFSFSGCGFLISYHLGVAHGLQREGYLTPSSKVAGASGGSIAALAVAAGVDVLEIHEEAKNMALRCHREGTLWKLEARLRAIFRDRFADVDVEKLGDRLIVTTEQLWPKRATIHSNSFRSPDDLCDAVLASCHIPFYLSPSGTARFRGEFHVDGGLLALVPEIPGYVKVCAFPAKLLRREDYEISPSLLDPDFPFSVFQLFRYALMPPQPAVLDQLFQLGVQTSAVWIAQQRARMHLTAPAAMVETTGQRANVDAKIGL